MHGAMLSVNNLWRKLQPHRLPKILGRALMFLGVHLAWVFFRAPDATSAFGMLKSMAGLAANATTGWDWTNSSPILTYPFVWLCCVLLFFPNSIQWTHWLARRMRSVWVVALAGFACGALILLSLVCGMSESMPSTPFVYFKF